jgi:transcriptional regulator with XRE-family HTH domain
LAAIQAPADSKNLVLRAKRRPRWVDTFHENFPRLLAESAATHSQLAIKTKVNSSAVLHWAQRRNYPARTRLPLIAKALGVSLQELAGHV